MFLSGLLLALALTPAAAPPGPTPSELVSRLAAGTSHLADLVDARLGLVWVDRFEGPADDAPPLPEPRHYCGAALTEASPALEQRLVDDAKRTLADLEPGGSVACGPGFGGTTCTVGATMEWDPAVHLVFVSAPATKATPARWALRAVLIDDDVLVEDALLASQHRTLASIAKRLGAKRCR